MAAFLLNNFHKVLVIKHHSIDPMLHWAEQQPTIF